LTLFKANTCSGYTPNARLECAVTADGQRLLIPVQIETSATNPITVLVNWTAAVKNIVDDVDHARSAPEMRRMGMGQPLAVLRSTDCPPTFLGRNDTDR
jgi:hypothetical protein